MDWEIKYYKDLNHNYLVIKGGEEGEKESYRSRMIAGNHFENMLPCSIRNMNGNTYFYYDISSRQSIKRIFEDRTLGIRQLDRLFEGICEASGEARAYLLEDSHILLDPEFIFVNPGAEEYSFLYYPREYDWDAALLSFAEFLVDRADHGEAAAVEIAYKVYERIADHTFILTEVRDLFPAQEELPETDERTGIQDSPEAFHVNIHENRSAGHTITESGEESAGSVFENSKYQAQYADDFGEGEEGEEWDTDESEEETGSIKKASAVLLALSLSAAAGILSLRYFFVLSAAESLLTIAGSGSLILVAALLLFSLLAVPAGGRAGRRRKWENRDEKRRTPEETGSMQSCRWSIPPDARTDTVQRKEETQNYAGAGSGYENTVFLDSVFSGRENKLYGTNKGNRYHIDLNSLPCTIGKMAGGVDFVIKDETVSRIHARFTEEGNEIRVTDLNSTNGTFKNGLRLEPNETVRIEPGDELRFGKMAFSYR